MASSYMPPTTGSSLPHKTVAAITTLTLSSSPDTSHPLGDQLSAGTLVCSLSHLVVLQGGREGTRVSEAALLQLQSPLPSAGPH